MSFPTTKSRCRLLLTFALICLATAIPAVAQNWTTISASNITDAAGNKLATGQICFLATDQNNVPINFAIGGGGQVLKRPVCAAVTNGAIAAGFEVPNPANTSPAGVLYHVYVRDTSTGQIVIDYELVSFTSTSWNLDNYQPSSTAVPPPPTPSSVTGPLNVNGDVSVSGTLSAGQIAGNPVFTGPVNARNIGQALYAYQYDWTDSLTVVLSPGALGNISLAGTALPAGLSSGAITLFSLDSSHTVLTRTTGDYFNAHWTNKSATIGDTAVTIASCTSATVCTLASAYNGSTTYRWIVVGAPSYVYINDAAPETVAVLGTGTTECPGGTATTICGIAANAHNGSATVSSSTHGIQEAINSLPSYGGTVIVAAAATKDTYGPIVVARSNVTTMGQTPGATFLQYEGTLGAYPAFWVINGSRDSLRDLSMNGTSATGDLIAWWDTTNGAGHGHESLINVNLGLATGTHLDISGTTTASAARCVYSSGAVNNLINLTVGSGCHTGMWIDSNGGAGADGTEIVASQFTSSVGDGLYVANSAGISINGSRFDFNGAWGINLNAGFGISVVGNYCENNGSGCLTNPGQLYGSIFAGNIVSQYVNKGTAPVQISSNPAAIAPSNGLMITGNYFLLNGSGPATVTSYISGGFSRSHVSANVFDNASAQTVANGVSVFNGGNGGNAGVGNLIASNFSGPNGGPANQWTDATGTSYAFGITAPQDIYALKSLALGGDAAMTAAPRMAETFYYAGTMGTTSVADRWTPDKAVTITRIEAVAMGGTPSCTVAPTISVSDGVHSATVNLSLSSTYSDSGALQVAMNAAQLTVSTAAGTCTTSPSQLNIHIEYRMQ